MSDRTQCTVAMVVGAAIGAAAGFLFFTDSGRRWRRQIEPALDDIARELTQFRGTVNRASGVAADSWTLVTEVFGEGRTPKYQQPRPF